MRSRILVLSLALLLALSSPSQAQNPSLLPVGIEFEYSGAGKAKAIDGKARAEFFPSILESIKAQSGGAGSVEMHPWNKFINARNTVYATYFDSEGKEWKVMPEQVSSANFDGYEFVTPPLRDEKSFDVLTRTLEEIESKKIFVAGVQSSSHFTFDVSHLIDKNENASSLVDAILYIENHWPEIYAGINPSRYGSTVNAYAVPLMVNQKELLNELGELPYEARTMSKVRSVFKKYEWQELQLVDRRLVHAWKFRAANYGKLFGLGNFQAQDLRVLEFRIPDLANAATVKRHARLLSSVLVHGPKAEPLAKFRDRLPDLNFPEELTPNDFKTLSKRMNSVSEEQFTAFLNQLHLSRRDYPKFSIPFSEPGFCSKLWKSILKK